MEQFLALIIPVTTPTQPPGGGDKPPGVPAHPIYYPPHIWGPTDPRPTHPIAGIPGLPGYEPPGGGHPSLPPGYPAHPIYRPDLKPEHPIVIVPPPEWKPPEGVTPPEPGEVKPIGGNQPVNPIVVPDFVLLKFPGYGWVAVGKPVPPTEPAK